MRPLRYSFAISLAVILAALVLPIKKSHKNISISLWQKNICSYINDEFLGEVKKGKKPKDDWVWYIAANLKEVNKKNIPPAVSTATCYMYDKHTGEHIYLFVDESLHGQTPKPLLDLVNQTVSRHFKNSTETDTTPITEAKSYELSFDGCVDPFKKDDICTFAASKTAADSKSINHITGALLQKDKRLLALVFQKNAPVSDGDMAKLAAERLEMLSQASDAASAMSLGAEYFK